MNKEDLTIAFQLTEYGFSDQLVIIFGNVGLNRQAFFGRGFHSAHIPYSHQGHVEGAGDGGGAQGEDIYLLPHLFEVFLMGDTKALLFVND
ncbi:hypothetical protein ES707_19204 [subsurface metagenome]